MTDATDFTWSHLLYRLFDADGALLYVGRTNNFNGRMSGHAHKQPWWDEVARATSETFPTFAALDHAERTAIQTEGPRYNSIRYGSRAAAATTKPPRKPRVSRKTWNLPPASPVIVRPVDVLCAVAGRIPSTELLITHQAIHHSVETDVYDETISRSTPDEIALTTGLSVPRTQQATQHLARAGWLIEGISGYQVTIPDHVFQLGSAACRPACGIHGGERGETGPIAPVRVHMIRGVS